MDGRFDEINRRVVEMDRTGKECKSEFLTHLLSSNVLTMKDIYSNTTECMLGGIDTVGYIIHGNLRKAPIDSPGSTLEMYISHNKIPCKT